MAPTNNNVVKVINIVLVDTDEQQQHESRRDPQEKLNRFDIVNHVEFCILNTLVCFCYLFYFIRALLKSFEFTFLLHFKQINDE